ncbi:putative nicotinate phosphoribosyltransferase [Neolecta irregularis DAH-3]|uniref:Nicotinate phosphoribosyltransferase n=1 Tax=Neolecta irregularis (strain DAH-3) TaxID=1198029 RepID=A0A1U7LI66_NEOID|nr:putative nicotinate phosphoribosyltransferase [Neolecta irregularis DAH-3]|eukprot:OLL22221.1 putative nicotinate phosphoribosyltransferase [Neolecta irregularis DAH-3]
MNPRNHINSSFHAPSQIDTNEIQSLLDTDLYKLSMSAVILKIYPFIHVLYRFKNRNPKMKFNQTAVSWLRQQINQLGDLQLSVPEVEFLREKCAYLGEDYISFLATFKLRPEKQVTIDFETNDLSLCVSGLWIDTILYEVPLLALISAAYFKFVDTDWSYDGQQELAREKATKLINAGCVFSEFGTRRRRNFLSQEIVLRGLVQAPAGPGKFAGTSNVHFARLHGLTPIGTVAHEFFMGTAAITGDYFTANTTALKNWQKFFGKELSIALTDTFSTDVFLKSLTKEEAESWSGFRQDSGNPMAFIAKVVNRYKELGVDFSNKVLVFSDSLNVDRCLELQIAAAQIKCSFGIGTFLTSMFSRWSNFNGQDDFKKPLTRETSAPMNIVIKLHEANGVSCVKISDQVEKNTGNNDEVKRVKVMLGIKGIE